MRPSLKRSTIAQIQRRVRSDRATTNLLQAIVSVGVAVTIAAAAVVASMAGGTWQDSVRAEIRWSAAVQADTSYLYRDEAPWAVDIAMMESRADALETAADEAGAMGSAALAESRTVSLAADELVAAQKQDHLISGTRYRSDQGFDLGRRLGDLEARGGVPRTTDAEMGAGDRLGRSARFLAWVAVVLVAGYLVTHAIIAARRPRIQRDGTGPDSLEADETDAGLVPHPWQRSATGLGIVAFAAWLLVTLLPVAQIHTTLAEQRAQAESASSAVVASSMAQVSNTHSGFMVSVHREVPVRSLLGLSREAWAMAASTSGVDEAQLVVAQADRAHATSVGEIAAAMSEPPGVSDGVHRETVRRLVSTPRDWQRTVAAQGRHADDARAAGLASTQLAVALLLAALTLSVAALARVMSRRRQRQLLLTSVVMLAGSAILGVIAVA